MSFGTLLKNERKKTLRLSQSKLAELSGVSRSYLSDVENNRYSPSVEFIEKVSYGLGEANKYNQETIDNIYNKLSEAAGYGSKEVHSKINNVTFDTKNLSVIYEFSTGEKISHNFKIVENTSILTNNQYNLEKVTITGAPLSIVKKLQDTYFDTDYGYKDNSKQVTIDYFRIRYFFDVKELLKTYLNDHNNIISFEDKEGVTQTVEVTKPITFILQETLPDKRVGYGDHITIE